MPDPDEHAAHMLDRIGPKLQRRYTVLKARAAAMCGMRSPQRFVFGHASDDLWIEFNTRYMGHPALKPVLPSLPSEQIQVSFIGSSGETALLEAARAYMQFKTLAAKHGRPITADSKVLDFGCGFGRMLRFFMRDVKPENLLGVDVLDLAVKLARETNPWLTFQQISPLPPSHLPSNTFDLIYLYSVFSHLSEDAHDRWLSEFARVLKPGGILVATTWDRGYIERCQRAREGLGHEHPYALRAFHNTSEWLAKYDRGEFCHDAVGGGTALSDSFYGETCIPEAYVRRRWTDRFDVCEFLERDQRERWQAFIVARRK